MPSRPARVGTCFGAGLSFRLVIAVGHKHRTGVVDALAGTAPEFMSIGDCVRPRKVLQAVRMGYDAAMAI